MVGVFGVALFVERQLLSCLFSGQNHRSQDFVCVPQFFKVLPVKKGCLESWTGGVALLLLFLFLHQIFSSPADDGPDLRTRGRNARPGVSSLNNSVFVCRASFSFGPATLFERVYSLVAGVGRPL